MAAASRNRKPSLAIKIAGLLTFRVTLRGESGILVALAMNGFTSRSVLLSLVSSLALGSAHQVMAQDAGAVSVAATESAQRQMAAREAAQKVQEARTAYTEGRYGVAVDCYRAALAAIPDVPATQKQVKFIRDSLADALVAKAMDYRKVGRTDEAVEFLKEAQKVSPGHQFAAAELAKTLDPVRTNPALTPKHVADVGEVNRLLSLAFGYYDLGNFDKAEETFASVLRIDPYNTAAQRGKEMVDKRRASYYKTAYDSYRAKALTEVDKQWDEHLPVEDRQVAVATSESGAAQALSDVENSIVKALQEMVIPRISFEEATMQDVQEALMGQISRFEASGIRASRPINVMTNFGASDSDMYKDVMSRRATLRLTDVTVAQLLELIDKQFGISHYISPLGIEFVLSGRDYGPLVERVYTVPPHFFDVQADAEEEDEEDDDFASSSSVRVKRVNPVVALTEMGVAFPKGATARYHAATRTLTVRNTLFNQKEIEELISMPLTTERAVVLNVIAMEMAEDDLNELGFEWLFNVNLNPTRALLSGVKDVVTGLPGIPDVDADLQSRGLSATEGLRSGNLALTADNMENLISSGSAAALSVMNHETRKAPGIFSFRGVWKNADVTMIMRGAAQKKGTDIMSNPRIVFTPGRDEQVVYANVKEMIYPETYAAPQIPMNPESMKIVAAAHPESFVRFGPSEDSVGGIGTVLQVHEASIAPDGQHVTLALTVTSNEFEGFINWGSPITVVHVDENNHETPMQISDNLILQPIFKRRMENTKITVGTGAVVVLGGLKEARSVRYEDKLPILGDLPMVGRLFRSSGEEKIRKAYLVFVKADVVDPTGRSVGSGEPVGNMSDL